MDATTIAMGGMIGVGLIFSVAGVFMLFRPTVKMWQVLVPFIFGMLMLGLSAFGLPFMTSYGEFLSKVLPLIKDPGTGTYSNAIDAIGSGKLSADNASTAKAIMLENPSSDLESLVERHMMAARDPDGKAVLREMLADLRAKKQMAGQIADVAVQENKVNGERLGSFDASTQRLVAQEIERRPHVLEKLNPADRESVKKFAVPRPPLKR
jgi:hypothetical protein